MEKQIWFPYLNPLKFFKTTRAISAKFQTKHFDDFKFDERLYFWQQRDKFKRIWQTDDIIYLQFESNFDPISVQIRDKYGVVKATFIAVQKLANAKVPDFFAYEISCSLAGLSTGCYKAYVTVTGVDGPEEWESDVMYISSTPIQNSMLVTYWHHKYLGDVLFETGIKFSFRVLCHYGNLDPVTKDDYTRNQIYRSVLVNSAVTRQWPFYFGGDNKKLGGGMFGCTDDEIDLLMRIFSCRYVQIDQKFFTKAEGSKFEFTAADRYARRQVKIMLEEGLNRSSSAYVVNTDTNKQIMAAVYIEGIMFGDTLNQGSANTVPVQDVQRN